jgi:L-asparagine transporter-like permease
MANDAAAPATDLKHELRVRHLLALSIGGAIASGFLLFVGQAVAIAGPAVLISYLLGGVILIAVMACLAELCVAKPVGSFATYARDAMGPLAGFLTGWNYWLAWVMGIATESVAAGTYLHAQYGSIPVWLTAFIIIAFEMIVNIIGVLLMGNYEVLLTTIKLIGLLSFVVIGILAILGVGVPHHGITDISSHGGFFPKGGGAVFAALLTVLFAYVGIEMVSVAAEECRDPKRDVPRALFLSVVSVIAVFLVGTIVVLAVLPWDQAGTSSSPFVDALNTLNLGTLASIFSWIVIIASVSAVDGGLYTASRMLFSLSREGHFHPALATTHPTRRVPTLATVATAGCAFIGALLAFFYPDTAYVFVASLSAFGFLFAWLMISLSQPLIRRKMGRAAAALLPWKTPLYPFTPIFAATMVLVALIGQFFTGGSGSDLGPLHVPGGGMAVVVGVIWTLLSIAYYQFYARRRYTHGVEWQSQEAEQQLTPQADPTAV